MPKNNKYPIPKKRFHGGRWRIYWKWNSKQYSLPTRFTDQKKSAAVDSDVRLVSAALAMDSPEFPAEYAYLPAALSYLTDREAGRHIVSESFRDPGNWLNDYEKELKSECGERWASDSMTMLWVFDKAMGGVENAAPNKVSSYLAKIAECRTVATRNRVRSVLSRFYRWAVDTHRTGLNPVKKTKALKEPRSLDIVYCTPMERDEIIALARQTGWPEWRAVSIAFYSGMRREELSRLQWEDINLKNRRLVVRKTKTREPHTIPISTILATFLSEVPESQRYGNVVPVSGEYALLWRMDSLLDLLRRIKQTALLQEWGISKPKPSKSAQYKQQKAAYQKRLEAKSAELKMQLKRIGWNSFRHTFGSLYAQENISLDKISAWMGNTPEVCRRHYAQFIPRDKRDNDINKMR